MINPWQRSGDRRHLIALRQNRPLDQIAGQPKGAGRIQFRPRSRTTAVLGDNHLHAVIAQQRHFTGQIKRPSPQQIIDLRQIQWRRHRINTTDQIAMVRGRQQGCQFLPPKGDKNSLWQRADLLKRGRQPVDNTPVIACTGLPRWSADCQMRQACLCGRRRRIYGHLLGKRMGCINQQVDLMVAQIAHQTRHTAEAAPARWHHLRQGVLGAARHRQGNRQMRLCRQCAGQLAGLCGTAQNQDMMAHD